MKPIIKWPGGKSREFEKIVGIIPDDIDTYIEPFFGGGGIFFRLEPKKAIINDINEALMSLYRLIQQQNSRFVKCITHIAKDWETLEDIAEKVYLGIGPYRNKMDQEKTREEVYRISKDESLPSLINGQEKYWHLLTNGVGDKLRRIAALEDATGTFNDNEFRDQIVAVTKGAYYYHLKDKFEPKTKEEEVAQFFFLREYCYGSMFRFNRNGKFNIPYGGASYNGKSFRSKLDYAFSPESRKLLQAAESDSTDFRTFFKRIERRITQKDFCFFDPPYDTEFSNYEKHTFGKAEQTELARVMEGLKCRYVMIIKKTELICSLYKAMAEKDSRVRIDEYGKNYTYNVRGRNERGVTHLLIRRDSAQRVHIERVGAGMI